MSDQSYGSLHNRPESGSGIALPESITVSDLSGTAPQARAPSEQLQSSMSRTLEAFRATHRQLLRFGMILVLLILAMEWIVIATRRPDPLLIERGSDFRTGFRIDINRATWVEWLQLDRIGPAMAHRIVADQKLHGPFKSIDDVGRVAGIGPATLDRIRPWLTMGHDHSDARTADSGNKGRTEQTPEAKQRQQTSL
jgi:competence protein ComEA